MMDDPDQGTYTFTGAQLKEQRRRWMDEGRRSALAEQALIEDSVQIPPCPFKIGDRTRYEVPEEDSHGHVDRHERTVQRCDYDGNVKSWRVYYEGGGWDWSNGLEIDPTAPLREGIDFYV